MKKVLIIAAAALLGLTACNGRNRLKQATQEVLQENPTAIVTRFQGMDSLTNKQYTVDVTFHPELQNAILQMDGKVYDLTQYPTASGFGYKNAEIDLRGKGDQATLNFTDGTIIDLPLKQITVPE